MLPRRACARAPKFMLGSALPEPSGRRPGAPGPSNGMLGASATCVPPCRRARAHGSRAPRTVEKASSTQLPSAAYATRGTIRISSAAHCAAVRLSLPDHACPHAVPALSSPLWRAVTLELRATEETRFPPTSALPCPRHVSGRLHRPCPRHWRPAGVSYGSV